MSSKLRAEWALVCGVGAAVLLTTAEPARAYTAAGDRLFPATLLLPQITPGDEFYFNLFSLPLTPNGPGGFSHNINLTTTVQKTITERLGVTLEETWADLGHAGGKDSYGWQNFETGLKYVAILDQPHEFVFTLGADREFGGTGAVRAAASPSGATTPEFFFGKGFGDLGIGYLRPLAVTGNLGYQFADTRPRPDQVVGGLAVEYSIPYLESKVVSLDLPEFMRSITPITEMQFTTPGSRSFGARTNALFAPGVSYAGEGWEVAVEGLVPATRATGRGFGVTAQFHLSLDFIMPESVGRPLLSGM
ncbi:MAG: hypothetical protein JO001_20980 [Alphaproteobacteria bacterium]|nr:hypothetical protein [Alphaproteobacteria bacterium]